MNSKRFLALASVAALIAGSACSDSRSITTEHVGDLGFGINLAKQVTNVAAGTIRLPLAPLPGTTANADSVRVRVIGIDSLTTGTYTVWFTNDSATKWALVTSGDLEVTQTDSAINAAGDRVITSNVTRRTGISGWRAGGPNKRLVFHTTRANSTIAATDSLNVVVVSIESGAPGTAPSENRILWTRRSDRFALVAAVVGPPPVPAFQPESGSIRFGNFKPRPAEAFIYTTNSANGIAPRGRIEVRGPIFVVNDSNYFRPPVGFYYAAYLIKLDSLNKVTDTLYLGRRTTPYPSYISLYNADKTNPDPTNVFDNPPVVYAMGSRLNADTIAKAKSSDGLFWRDFGVLNITLENRFAQEGRMGPNIITTVALPGSIRGR
ncbi:MAG: hypothetical protein ABJB66_14380 [Gemmatimonadaceae bacterium]